MRTHRVIGEWRYIIYLNHLGFIDFLKERSKVVKKVPKGTSSYQAEWILDEDGESGGEGDEYDDIEQEDFMEEESQVSRWALRPLLCTALNARQNEILTLRGMCGQFLRGDFVVAGNETYFITESLRIDIGHSSIAHR